MSRSPTFAEAFTRAVARALAEVRVSMPARVERYDKAKQLVDVQPLIKEAHADEEGERIVEPLPVIANVPVVFPGAGPFRLTVPIAAGDTVLLVFCASSLDVWLAQGGVVDPLDDNRFRLADAIAVPGLRDFGHPLASASDTALTLGHDSGAQIFIDQAEVRLGADTGVQFVALANRVLDRLTAIVNAFNAHTHGSAVGPTTVPVTPLGAPASVASSNVKAKE
jgi:hypothetical protein